MLTLSQWLSRILPIALLAAIFLISFMKVNQSSNHRWRYLISALAFIWAIDIAVFTVAKLAYILATDIPTLLADLTTIRSFLVQVRMGQMLLLQLVIALVIALTSQLIRTKQGFKYLALITMIGILPPALTGHSGNTANHELAVTTWMIHILSISIWISLVAAILFIIIFDNSNTSANIQTVSRLSMACFIGTFLSGSVNAWIRMPDISSLFTSQYGQILITKILIFVFIGLLATIYRLKILSSLEVNSKLFIRLLATELALMGLAVMFGVLLSETKFPIVKVVPN